MSSRRWGGVVLLAFKGVICRFPYVSMSTCMLLTPLTYSPRLSLPIWNAASSFTVIPKRTESDGGGPPLAAQTCGATTLDSVGAASGETQLARRNRTVVASPRYGCERRMGSPADM